MKECINNGIDELISENKGKQGKPTTKVFSSLTFYIGCHQKVYPKFRVGLPNLNDAIYKVFHMCAQLWPFPDLSGCGFPHPLEEPEPAL